MLNRHDKGVRYQLLFIKEYTKHIAEKEGSTVISIWNAPNIRPSKKPDFLGKHVKYSNKDFLQDWDVGIFTLLQNGYNRRKQLRLIQIKSQIDYKLYEELHTLYTGSDLACYFATYQKGSPEKIEDKLLTKLPHFWLARMPHGEFR